MSNICSEKNYDKSMTGLLFFSLGLEATPEIQWRIFARRLRKLIYRIVGHT